LKTRLKSGVQHLQERKIALKPYVALFFCQKYFIFLLYVLYVYDIIEKEVCSNKTLL
jgi:hypothetical protein